MSLRKDRAGFVNGIRKNPDDDTARLVFADWLEDHGEPDRAELYRAGVRGQLLNQPEVLALNTTPLRCNASRGAIDCATGRTAEWMQFAKHLYEQEPIHRVYLEDIPEVIVTKTTHHKNGGTLIWEEELWIVAGNQFVDGESFTIPHRHGLSMPEDFTRYFTNGTTIEDYARGRLQEQRRPQYVLASLWPGVRFDPAPITLTPGSLRMERPEVKQNTDGTFDITHQFTTAAANRGFDIEREFWRRFLYMSPFKPSKTPEVGMLSPNKFITLLPPV